MLQLTRFAPHPRYAPRNAHYGGMIGNRVNHHRSRADFGVVADRDIAQDFSSGSDHNVVADARMPLALFLARPAQRDALIHQNIISDFSGFTDHDAHAVIDKAPPPDLRAGVNLNSRERAIELREHACQKSKSRAVHSMAQPVQQDGVKPGVAEKNLDRTLGGWIPPKDRIDLFPNGLEHIFIRLSHRRSGCRFLADPGSARYTMNSYAGMRESVRNNAVLYLLAAGALAIVVVRACVQSMTIDESNKILEFVAAPAGSHWYPSSGNHVLDSALAKLFVSIFGINELTSRGPSILGAILYISSALYFCVLITPRKFLRCIFLSFLIYNPLILDYLIVGRGYALAIGCLFAALCLVAKIVLGRGESGRFAFYARWASFFVAVSFCSNFSFAYVDALTMAVFFVWAASSAARAKLGYLRSAECCFLPGILTAIAICGPTVWQFPRSQLYFGSTSLKEMWHSVISAAFDELNADVLNSWMMTVLRSIRNELPIASIVMLAALLIAVEWQRWRARKPDMDSRTVLLRLWIAIGLVSFLAHWIAFRAARIPLPEGRTALMFVLLWSLAFLTALAARYEIPRFDPIRVAGAVVLAASVAYFAGCLRLGYFKEWQFDADTKRLYWLVTDLRTRCNITKFSIDWRYSSALDFYRLAYKNVSIPNFPAEESGNIPTNRDAYVLFHPTSEDFIRQQKLQVTYTDPESGSAVAIRGCPADTSTR